MFRYIDEDGNHFLVQSGPNLRLSGSWRVLVSCSFTVKVVFQAALAMCKGSPFPGKSWVIKGCKASVSVVKGRGICALVHVGKVEDFDPKHGLQPLVMCHLKRVKELEGLWQVHMLLRDLIPNYP